MGLFDSNKSTTNTTTTTNNTESNQQSGSLNLAKNANVDGNITISNGVVETNEEMRKVAEAAFNFGGDAFEFGESALDMNGEVVANSLGFGEFALEMNGEVVANSLGFGESALANSLDFGSEAIQANTNLVTESLEFSESLVNQQTANSNSALLALKDLANNLGTDGAADNSAVITKAMYVLGGVSVVFLIIFVMFRK